MQMGLIRYTYDQSYPAFQALGLLDAGIWPLIGQPSSVFLDNPALMPYIQAVPLILFRSPWAVQGLILILNSAAIWFVWRVATELLGRRAGWVAAMLFAVNPWVVFFSRTTWVQSLVPFFMAVIAWGLWPSFVEDRPSARRFFAGGVALTLLTQTYIQAWGVLPQIGLLIVVFWRRVPRRAFWAAAGIFAAAALLYALGLATRSDVNSVKATNFLAAGWQGFSAIGLRHGLRFVNGIDFRPAYADGNPAGALWEGLSLLAVTLVSLGFLAGVVRAVLALRLPGRDRRLGFVLLTWFFIPVLITSIEGAFDIHPHYLMLTLPAGHLLAAWGIAPILRGRALPATAAALLLIGLIFAHDLYRANELVGRSPRWPEFDGWSLAAGAEAGQVMRNLLTSDAGTYPRRIVANGGKELLSGLSATSVQTIRGVAYPDFVVLPAAEPLLYVIDGGGDFPAWFRPFVDADTTRTLTFDDGAQITLAETAPDAAVRLAEQPIEPVEWGSEAGITLAGYTLEGTAAPGSALELITYWRVDELNPGRAEWYVAPSYHLLDEAGNLIANVGEHGQWAYRWELGDIYIQRMTIPVPDSAAPGDYSLEIGLFDSVRGVAYSLFDDGAAVGSYAIPLAEKNE